MKTKHVIRPSFRRTIGQNYPCVICEEDFPLEYPHQKTCSEKCAEMRKVNNRRAYIKARPLSWKKQQAEAARLYYHSHTEKYRQKSMDFYYKHRDAILATKKGYYQSYYEKNKEKIKERTALSREANLEKCVARQKGYYQKHKEEILDRNKKYYQLHRVRILERRAAFTLKNKEGIDQ